MADTEYLAFFESDSTSGKTKVLQVYSKRHGDLLGTIGWYGPWRQYAFHPAEATVWNVDCLKVINGKIEELMAGRRVSKDNIVVLSQYSARP